MELIFEWDEEKSKKNLKKHNVTFDEGKTIFNDPFAITIADPYHGEEHYIDIGLSIKEKLLVVWYVCRENNIRIIGCRKATVLERKIYEEKK